MSIFHYDAQFKLTVFEPAVYNEMSERLCLQYVPLRDPIMEVQEVSVC